MSWILRFFSCRDRFTARADAAGAKSGVLPCTIAFVALGIACAAAQQSDTSSPSLQGSLTLTALLQEVLTHHPVVRSADQQLRIAESQVAQAQARPSPEISYEYSRLNNFGNLSELIEFPGKRRLRTQIAEIGIGQAQQNLLKVKSTLAFEVRQAFFRRLLADQQRLTAEHTLTTVRQLSDVAQKRFEAGDVAEIEVIKAKVEAARAEQQVRIATGRQRVATLGLNVLLGRKTDAQLMVQGDLGESAQVPILDELLQQAYRDQPAIVAARQEVQKQQKALLLAQREKFPDVRVGVTYGVEDRERTPGINASVPIPSRSRYRGLVGEATGRQLAAVAEVEGQTYQVTQTLASAYEQWLAAAAQVDVYRGGLLLQSETMLKAAEESYREGQTGILDVLDAERTHLLVQQEYQQALFDLQVAAANVTFARGGVD